MADQVEGEYRLSGNLGLSMLGVPLISALAISLLSIIYAYISVYSPIAGWISILFVVGFAFGVGVSVSLAAQWSKCRNMSYVKMMGAIAAVFAFYTSWVAFEYVLFSRYSTDFEGTLLDIFLHPQAVWNIAQGIAEEGWYSIASMQISGIALWVFWAMEAAIIVTVTWLLAPSSLESSVYCESCGVWAEEYEGCTRFELPEGTEDISQYHPQNLALPLDLPSFSMPGKGGIRLDAWTCPKCSDLAAVQAHLVKYSIDEDGDLDEEDEPISPIFMVSSELVEALHAHRDAGFLAMEAEEAAELSDKTEQAEMADDGDHDDQ